MVRAPVGLVLSAATACSGCIIFSKAPRPRSGSLVDAASAIVVQTTPVRIVRVVQVLDLSSCAAFLRAPFSVYLHAA